eukprot:5896563-Amphidinium_carterae.1
MPQWRQSWLRSTALEVLPHRGVQLAGIHLGIRPRSGRSGSKVSTTVLSPCGHSCSHLQCKEYTGGRTEETIVTWVLKKVGPPATRIEDTSAKPLVQFVFTSPALVESR